MDRRVYGADNSDAVMREIAARYVERYGAVLGRELGRVNSRASGGPAGRAGGVWTEVTARSFDGEKTILSARTEAGEIKPIAASAELDERVARGVLVLRRKRTVIRAAVTLAAAACVAFTLFTPQGNMLINQGIGKATGKTGSFGIFDNTVGDTNSVANISSGDESDSLFVNSQGFGAGDDTGSGASTGTVAGIGSGAGTGTGIGTGTGTDAVMSVGVGGVTAGGDADGVGVGVDGRSPDTALSSGATEDAAGTPTGEGTGTGDGNTGGITAGVTVGNSDGAEGVEDAAGAPGIEGGEGESGVFGVNGGAGSLSAPGLIPLGFTPANGFMPVGADQDTGRSIYFFMDEYDDNVVVTLENGSLLKSELSSSFEPLNLSSGLTAYCSYSADFSVLTFELDGVVYELTCRYDLNTLLDFCGIKSL